MAEMNRYSIFLNGITMNVQLGKHSLAWKLQEKFSNILIWGVELTLVFQQLLNIVWRLRME